jgi:hypothetical protein
MTAMPAFHLRVWNPDDGEVAEVPLRVSEPGTSETVNLRCLPGASAVHVVLSDIHGVRLRAEVSADPGETVPLRVELDEQGVLHLWTRERNVLLFRADSSNDPLPPIQPAAEVAQLDLVVVIDGTIRNWAVKDAETIASPQLLADKDRWMAHVETLLDLAARIAAHRDSRMAMLAFGDQPQPAMTAIDLKPLYPLYPREDERVLQPFDAERLREKVLAVSATSGGDFVDALGDALAACLRLRWREGARKLVILSGDSPGASLLHPLPNGADFCVRRLDVDTQVLDLHRLGVEVVTIYHAPPRHLVALNRELLEATRRQYCRLASLPELAFEASTFDPGVAAERLTSISRPIARGAALGEVVKALGTRESAITTPAATPGKPSALRRSSAGH